MTTPARLLAFLTSVSLLGAGLALANSAGAVPAAQAQAPPRVVVAKLADAIQPITAEFVIGALEDAEQRRADLFVLEIDTPGGLDASMRDIIQAFEGSSVPVCLFVSPSGAGARSAGFFLAMAADYVAMSPSTTMGAASPVPVGGGEMDETMARKIRQDAEAYMRSLAANHGRPADLAVAAVSEGVSYSAEEAVESGLADLLVGDRAELLAALSGRQASGPAGETLGDLAGAEIVDLEMSLRQRILAVLANPQVAYLLMLLGLAGLYFEISTPGAVLPGVLGAISLVLAMLGLQQLPIDFAGLALIGLAILFFILEVKVVSYGLLTVAGLVAFVLGSLMLIPGPIPELRLQLSFVLPVALSILGIVGFLISLVIRTHRGQVHTGAAGLVTEVGTATQDFGPGQLGKVFVHGELWKARSDADVRSGDEVEVVDIEDGMTIRVRPRAPEKGD